MTIFKTTVAALALAVAAPAFAEDMKTVVDLAVASPDHTTLVQAVTAGELVDTLKGEGPFTVFAPTNAAFEKVDATALADLLKPENKEKLQQVLKCHVVAGDVMSPAVGDMIMKGNGMAEIETLGGCKLTASIREADKALVLKDENGTEAVVTTPDLDASNGVIHVIDTVVMPKM